MPASFPPIEVPLINGVVWSFAHIEIEIVGIKFTGGFKGVKYSRKRNREYVYSNSPDPVGKTLGQNEYTGSLELYLAWWYAMLETIESELGEGYGDQPFLVNVTYSANGFNTFQDTLVGCTFDSTEADQSAGTAALTRMVELNPVKIFFNGKDDLENTLTSAA